MPLSPDMLNIDRPKEKAPQATKEERKLMKRAWQNRKTKSINWTGALQEFLSLNFTQEGSKIIFVTTEDRAEVGRLLEKIRQYSHTHEFLESLTQGL